MLVNKNTTNVELSKNFSKDIKQYFFAFPYCKNNYNFKISVNNSHCFKSNGTII